MNCQVETYRSYENPVLAGNVRFLLGFVLALAGFYITALAGFQGHGLGFFLMLAAPFVIFKDGE